MIRVYISVVYQCPLVANCNTLNSQVVHHFNFLGNLKRVNNAKPNNTNAGGHDLLLRWVDNKGVCTLLRILMLVVRLY